MLVCRLCQFATRCPASALSPVPARSSLDRGTVVVGERCPCGFRTLKAVRVATRATQSICRRRGCCAGPEWRCSRSGTSCVWLAIRTSRPYLSATNVRLEHIRIVDRACEILCGPLPSCGSCTLGASSPGVPLPALSMGDARPGRPSGFVSAGPDVARMLHTCQRSAALLGFGLPFAGLIPPFQGSGCFHSHQTPHARLPPPFISRPFSSGGRRCQIRSTLDATVAGWGGCASGIRFRS